jgi:hypothetical protein
MRDCDFNQDGDVDQTEMGRCEEEKNHEGPMCDMNDDGQVDPEEAEQCKAFDVPECDFSKGEPSQEQEEICMDKVMQRLCDFNKDGQLDETEKEQCKEDGPEGPDGEQEVALEELR